jgi:hypothetical protein
VQGSGIADSMEKLAITRVSISSGFEVSDWLDLIPEIRSRAPIGQPRLQPRDFSRVVLDAHQLLPLHTLNTLTTTLLTTYC